jgi:HAD superfamily hydrolase (TIGR01490 family)
MRAAFFDLDGTLTAKPSCELRFLHYLWRHGRLGPRQFAAGFGFYPRWLFRYGAAVGRKNKAFLTGLAVAEVDAWALCWVNTEFEPLLNSAVVAQLQDCRQTGYQVVLLTGALECLARPIAERLALHDCIATRCASAGGYYLPAPPPQHPLGPAKLALASAWCREHGAELADCAAYGDSLQDRHLLEAVGLAVAVNPDRGMSHLAASRHWRVLSTG